jgi:hypothetical protein
MNNLATSWSLKNILKEKYLGFILITFCFTTFSGAVRKWVIDSSAVSNSILAFQLLLPICFIFLKGALRFEKCNHTLFNIFFGYIIVLLIMAFNPDNLTIYHGILGFIIHAGFWLGILVYLKMRENLSIEKLVPIFLIITFGLYILATIQSASPGTAFINKYAANENEGLPDAYVGDSVRVSATFSYISGFNSYLFFAIVLCCALIKLQYNRLITITLISTTLYACLLSGSRGSTYFFMLCIPFYIVTCAGIKNNSQLLVACLVLYIVGALFNFLLGDKVGVLSSFNKSYENFSTRTANAEENNERTSSQFTDIIDYDGPNPVFGLGLGATYQGAVKMFGFNPQLNGVDYEGESKRVILEGGFTLFLIRTLLFIFLFSQLRIPFLFRGFLLGIIFFGIPLIFNTYTSYYALVGLMLLDRTFIVAKQQET